MMYCSKRNQQGHSIMVLCAVLLVAGIVGLTVWRYMEAGRPKQSVIVVNSYDSCLLSPDRTIVSSRPKQCVTKDGRAFTQGKEQPLR
jgi:hypothetical protein